MTGLVVDLFAGGGGASLGLEWAGLAPDIAINHDLEAVAVHRANHPGTRHFCENIWAVDPVEAVGGRDVELLWASPDCKHFSKAKGKALADRNIRALAWVVWKWARLVRPNIIILENVEEFRTWGPVVDGIPDLRRKGLTFNSWVGALERLGYRVESRELRACDYGAPTIRKRFFLVARCDHLPIVWPEPSHGPGLIPYRAASECIDFSLACPSIFLSKEEAKELNVRRPLAENTLKRIARGIQKFVIDTGDPFIINYYGLKRDGEFRGSGIHQPLATQTTENRFGLVQAFLSRQFGRSVGSGCNEPVGTTTAGGGGKSALVTAFMAQHNTGRTGHDVRGPLSTITARGTQQQLVTSHLMKMKGTCRHGQQLPLPFPTVCAGGGHLAEVRAFLTKYYGVGDGQSLNDPMATATTKDRMGLVTVAGENYEIVDIGMRMLNARELFRAQGFPDSYQIDVEVNGRRLSKTAQVRLCGNSVPPQWAEALARVNVGGEIRKAAVG